jgi:hypothetical protein
LKGGEIIGKEKGSKKNSKEKNSKEEGSEEENNEEKSRKEEEKITHKIPKPIPSVECRLLRRGCLFMTPHAERECREIRISK